MDRFVDAFARLSNQPRRAQGRFGTELPVTTSERDKKGTGTVLGEAGVSLRASSFFPFACQSMTEHDVDVCIMNMGIAFRILVLRLELDECLARIRQILGEERTDGHVEELRRLSKTWQVHALAYTDATREFSAIYNVVANNQRLGSLRVYIYGREETLVSLIGTSPQQMTEQDISSCEAFIRGPPPQ